MAISDSIFGRQLRLGIIVMLLISFSGCTQLGGFSRGGGCEEKNCDASGIIGNSNTNNEWVCHGEKGSSGWQCKNVRDSSKEVAVSPKVQQFSSENRFGPTFQSRPERSPVGELAGSASQSKVLSKKVQKTNAPYADGAEIILQQPRDSYAVQLLALQKKTDIVSYAKLSGLYYSLHARLISHGSEWYVLLLGIYPDRLTANSATEEWVRDNTRRVKPWIRKLGPLQDAIRAVSKE